MIYPNDQPPTVRVHSEGRNGFAAESSIPSLDGRSQAPLLASLRYLPLPEGRHFPEGAGYKQWNTPAKAKAFDAFVREKAVPQRGVYLGSLGNGVVDVDLDFWKSALPEPVKQRLQAFALATLPSTKKMWGRNAQRIGHLLYRCLDLPVQKNLSLGDPLIVELRCEGQVMENGVHPHTGQPIFHHAVDEPAEVRWQELSCAVGFFAAVAMTVAVWEQNRHFLAFGLSGYLVKNKIPPDEVKRFVEAVTQLASDEEPKDRVRTVDSAQQKAPEELAGLGWLVERGLVTPKWARDFEHAVALWTGVSLPKWNRAAGKAAFPANLMAVVEDVGDLKTEYAEPIVPGLIYRGRVTILAGEPGIGKTTLLLEILHAAGTGERLWGKHLVTRVKVAWVDADHPWTELKETLENYYDWNPKDLCYRLRFKANPEDEPEPLPLTAETYPLYRDAIREHEFELLVADTLGDFLTVRDLNDDSQARDAMSLVRKLTRETNCAVVLVHHLNKKTYERGIHSLSGSNRLASKTDLVVTMTWENRKQGVVKLDVGKDRFGEMWEAAFQRDRLRRRLIPQDEATVPTDRRDAVIHFLATRENATRDEIHQYLHEAGFPTSKEAVKKLLQRLHEQKLLSRREEGYPRRSYYSLATRPPTTVGTVLRGDVPTVPTVPTERDLNSKSDAPVGTSRRGCVPTVPTGNGIHDEREEESLWESLVPNDLTVPTASRCSSGDTVPTDVPTESADLNSTFVQSGQWGQWGHFPKEDVPTVPPAVPTGGVVAPSSLLEGLRAQREAEGLGWDERIIAGLYAFGKARGFPKLPPIEGVWLDAGEPFWLDALTLLELDLLARVLARLTQEVA